MPVTSPDRRTLGRGAAQGLAVAVAACVPYLGALSHGFVFDDVQNVVQNPWLRGASRLSEVWTSHAAGFDPQFATSYYRPVMHSVYMATYGIAGLSGFAFHAVNLALHTVAAWLVYSCFRGLLRKFDASNGQGDRAALVAGLCFAVHPVHVEAVAWLAGITDLTFTVFGLASLLVFMGARSSTRVAASGALLLLAMLSKEPAVVLPLLFLAIERWSGRLSWGSTLRRMWPIGAAIAIYLFLRWNALGGFAPHDNRAGVHAGTAIPAALELFGTYLRYLLLPFPLNALHPFDPPESIFDVDLLAAAAWIAAFAATWPLTRGHPLPRVALLAVALPLLPVLWIPALGEGVFAERYLYFPSAGLAWAAGWAALTALRSGSGVRVRTLAVCGSVVLIAAGIATLHRVPVWRDSLSLWTDTVRKSPASAAAREYLCFALYEAHRFDDATTECRESLRLDPTRVDARINLGNALAMKGDLGGALAALDEALRLRPTSVEAWTTRGLVRMAQGATEDALASYRRALTIHPDDAEAHNALGVALARLGRPAEARRELREAVRLAPGREEYRLNLEALGGAP